MATDTPTTPDQAAAPACRGVPVAGAPFFAQTVSTGVNARAGAGTGYGQVNRFGGDCTLGFDGYCIGEPIGDPVTQLPDTRWLIVHSRRYLVASARVRSQSKEADLGGKPAADCARRYGGLPQPGPPNLVVKVTSSLPPAAATLSVTAKSAALIGYAVRVLDPSDGSYPYSLIKVKQNAPTFAGTWAASSAVPDLLHGTGRVELAAATCLAADVPSGPPAVYRATFRTGQLVALVKSKPVDPRDAALLAHTACSGPP